MRKRDEDKIVDALVRRARKILELKGRKMTPDDGCLWEYHKFPLLIRDTGPEYAGIIIKLCDDHYEMVCREIATVAEDDQGRKVRLKRLTKLTHEIAIVNELMAKELPLDYLADI